MTITAALRQSTKIPGIGFGTLEAPSHWALSSFAEVCKIVGGSQPPKSVFRDTPADGYIRLIQIRDYKSDKHITYIPESEAKRFCDAQDIMIGRYGPPIFQILRGLEGAYNVALMKAVPVEGLIEPDYLYYFLQEPRIRHYVEFASLRTAGQSGVNKAHLEKYPVFVPPLNEQRRIIAKIEELTARSRNAKQALDAIPPLLERFRQSVLAAAFRGDLTKQWRQQNPDVEPASELLKRIRQERRHRWEQDYLQTQKAKGKEPKNDNWKAKYKEPEPVDTTGLPELPEGWCWASMGEAFEVCVGATPSRKRPDYWGGSIPWVSSGEVAFCRISSTRETITEDGLKNSSTSLHPPGTLLIGMIGEGKTRGQVAILDIEACNNQNAAAIRVSLTPIPTEYVYRYLEGQYQATRLLGSGNNQQALNKTRVQAMIIPIAPLAEQEAICTELETLLSRADAISEFTDNSSDRMTTLNQSILAKAFRGELVPQDPNDEPASALLERIRSQQNTSAKR